MDSLELSYNRLSPKRELFRNRFQLLSASIVIFLGYADTFNEYTGALVTLPIIGFCIAILDIFIAKAYTKLEAKFGHSLEYTVFRINGLIMFVGGLGYHFLGSQFIQYAYYFIAFVSFFILPHVSRSAKKKKTLCLSDSFILINRKIGKPIIYKKDNIYNVELKGSCLIITLANQRQKKYYLIDLSSSLQMRIEEILQLIKIRPSE